MQKKYNNPELKRDLEDYYDSFARLEKHRVGSKVVGDLGERFAEEICGITPSHKNAPYVDGIDRKRKRVQIKTRRRHKGNPNAYVFRPFNKKKLNEIDYALFVILNEKFWLDEMWKVGRKTLQEHFKKTVSDSFCLTNGKKIRKGVRRVY